MLKQLMIMLILIVIASCTPSDTVNNNTDSGATPTREGDSDIEVSGDPGSGFGLSDESDDGGFVAELSGAETETLSGAGIINCENSVYVIRPSLDSFPQISLILPRDAGTGSFNLVNNPGDGSAASATVFFDDGRVFAIGVDGILIVDAIATEAGQAVQGSFDFSASSGSEIIDARGEFDFISGEDTIYCP